MPEKHLTTLYALLSQPPLPDDLSAAFINYSHEDWEGILDLAGKHNLIPLLYARLKSLGLSHTIPTAILENMRQAMLTNATRNAIFLHEAKTLLDSLQKANIPVIGLKGVYLLENIYPDISTRTMNDLDLMLKKADIPEALTICQSLGYQPTTYFDINDPNLDIKHVPPLKKEPGPYLELHWTILEEDEPFTINAKSLWERAVPATIAGVDALALSPEDLILHLCLHLAYQHQLKLGLRGLYDVAAVLQHFKAQLNGAKMAAIAQEWGANRVLGLTLALAVDLLRGPIPSGIYEQLQQVTIEPWVQEEARRQLLDQGHPSSSMTPDLAKFANEKGAIKRIQMMLKRIFLPKGIMSRLYNVPPTTLRIYGCYFRRAWELLTHYRHVVRLALSKDATVLMSAQDELNNQHLLEWMQRGI